MVAQLAGLSTMGVVPWLAVCVLFETKIDSILGFGRWLFILMPNAVHIIDQAYERWSRTLLGADWWRNAAVCGSELGWNISGFARVVYAVAMKRAKLWLRGIPDWHARFFVLSNVRGLGWSKQSLSVLTTWSLLDWPAWFTPGASLESYRAYVLRTLSSHHVGRWRDRALKHKAQVPYCQFAEGPGLSIQGWRLLSLPGDTLTNMRSYCRLRCGLLVLRHLRGKKSMALLQSCVFCNIGVRNATVH